MPHFRDRFALEQLKKLFSYWPVTGIIGPRQCGKTTLAKLLLPNGRDYTFDDAEIREEAVGSIKTFVARLGTPALIDEVQKVPAIFDELKRVVDKKKLPGSYLITGSTSFSDQVGIRESLTGRIGILELHPLNFAERNQLPVRPAQFLEPWKGLKPRVSAEKISQDLALGGMPVPAFARSDEQRNLYWTSWLETTLYRDLGRVLKKNYDAEIAFSLVRQMGKVLADGELPTLKHFKEPASTVRRYLSGMETIFLLYRHRCHPSGIGKEAWQFMDAGLSAFLMKKVMGEGATLTLVRHFLWNEWRCLHSYAGNRIDACYYKSAQGSPVDYIVEDIPIRIVSSLSQMQKRLSWEERPIRGAMKKLKSPYGMLVGPIENFVPPKENDGVALVPWGGWS